MPLIRRSGDRTRPPVPKHPYRDTAVIYGVMASVLVAVAALTGGDVARAAAVAVAFFVVATAWSWWRFRERIREQEARAAGDASGSQQQEGGE
jgi:membrane protein implicated in regulation of membrane protease activity